MNDEYISKKQAVDLLRLLPNPYNLLPLHTIGMAIYYIENEPAADVQPVKHGRWIWDSNAPHREHGAYKCSNCGCHSDFEENYCYNCGARMDGDTECQ